jgi:predicted NBD/HSP70 family sugar kinase
MGARALPIQPARHSRRSTPQQFQRQMNLALVLRALRDDGPASRSVLAERIGIDRSTMTSIAGELLEVGLINEHEGASTGIRGGRRPRVLSLSECAVQAVGVEIGDSVAEWVACSLTGSPRARGRLPRPPGTNAGRWVRHVLREVRGELDARLKTTDGPRPVVAGVGVGVPGVVDPFSGMLRESVVLGASDLALRDAWHASGEDDRRSTGSDAYCADAPLIADNDANCCAWNIAHAEPGAGTTIFVQLTMHRRPDGSLRPSYAGVGLSFVIDGVVYYGSSHAAGELRGYRWRRGDADQLGLARSGSEDAARTRVTEELLRNLGVIASALDPRRIVLGGELAGHERLVRDQLTGVLADTSLVPLLEAGALTVAAPGEHPVSLGAARMVLHHLFALPSLEAPMHDGLDWQALIARRRG